MHVANYCVKNYTSLLFNRQTKELHIDSTHMSFKIAFTHVSHGLRRRCHCPIAAVNMSVVQLCRHHTWTSRYFATCFWYTFSCMILQTDLSTRLNSGDSKAISQVVCNPVSVRTVCNSSTDVMCYITSGKGLTQVVNMQ